jgi:recombination protein RecT
MAQDALIKFENDFKQSVSTRLQHLLPPHIAPVQFEAVVMTAVRRSPQLLHADRASLFEACVQAASHGLLPDGSDGIITTFKDTRSGKTLAQWLPMVKGILKRARELGDLTAINAYPVYEADNFHVELGDTPKITHVPSMGTKRGEIVAAYAIFKNGDEVIHREIMTREEIDKTRKVSRASSGGAWRDWYPEMARKTVIRRGAKSVPMSMALSEIIQHEDQYVDFNMPKEPKVAEGVVLDDGFSEARQSTISERLQFALASAKDNAAVCEVLGAFEEEVGRADAEEKKACQAIAQKALKKFAGEAA